MTAVPVVIQGLVPALQRGAGALIAGRVPTWVILGIQIPAAYLGFLLGALSAFVELPQEYDRGRCVISRLCSPRDNPVGFPFMTLGLLALAGFLAPVPAWIVRRTCVRGCPRLLAAGRTTFWIALAAITTLALERSLFSTQHTRYEIIHMVLAALSFGGLWLGTAMLAGASTVPRVKWRWLWRPPWFLTACVLPMLVITVIYLPINLFSGATLWLIEAWPRRWTFLRTATFWQWYLVATLLHAVAAQARRAGQLVTVERPPALGGSWRLDVAAPASLSQPHRARQEREAGAGR